MVKIDFSTKPGVLSDETILFFTLAKSEHNIAKAETQDKIFLAGKSGSRAAIAVVSSTGGVTTHKIPRATQIIFMQFDESGEHIFGVLETNNL